MNARNAEQWWLIAEQFTKQVVPITLMLHHVHEGTNRLIIETAGTGPQETVLDDGDDDQPSAASTINGRTSPLFARTLHVTDLLNGVVRGFTSSAFVRAWMAFSTNLAAGYTAPNSHAYASPVS